MLLEVKSSISSVNGFVKLLERLLGARQVRREERFEQFIRPLHDKLQEVHLDYSSIFRQFRSQIRSSTIEAETMELIPDHSQAKVISQAKKNYLDAREQQESIRDILRYEARAILEQLSHKKEQRYVCTLIAYFHEQMYGDQCDPNELDFTIEQILRIGGDAVMETPSTKLLREISGVYEAKNILMKIGGAIDEQNRRFNAVTDAYVRLAKSVLDGKS